jgi:selenide,water dikinase
MPPEYHLVLAGGGHSHALLLRMWAMDPKRRPARSLISLVSRHSTALYSGMVPGLVAGLYRPGECAMDLRRLCTRAGVAFVLAEISGLDLERQELLLERRPELRFDHLSLDLGAVTASDPGGGRPVKPLEPFLAWLGSLPPGAPIRIRGGGLAAVELALALAGRGYQPELLLRGESLSLGSKAANRAGERLLAEALIPLNRQVLDDTRADLACTGSRAPAWLAASGLPVDAASGRVLTEPSLQVLGHPRLFASGDCGLIASDPRPAAGVWAVRAAPTLATNLQRSLEQPQRPLRPWRPQPRALQLLGDGGARRSQPQALALWGPLTLGPSPWLWRWKEWIDRGFIERFEALAPMAVGAAPEAMACRGCAAKLAASPLANALARLSEPADKPPTGTGAKPPNPMARLGGIDLGTPANRANPTRGQAPQPEDAALVTTTASGELLLQSIDGFPALVDDPWLNARLTTLHACSDLWASGARVTSVQALVTVPEAGPQLQEDLLFLSLAGVRSVLDPLGASLIGGHTLEGRDGAGLALALTVNGTVAPEHFWPKGPLQSGDLLLLSRPIGTGVLFASAMAGAAEAAWLDGALALMQQSQAELVALLQAHGCRACTDITGFGLLGHLGEMVAAAGPGIASAGVELDGLAIPALAGSLELLAQGHASTLAPSNAAALALLDGPIQLKAPLSAAQLGLLIDPQTCGPLLAALPADQAPAALAAMQAAGFAQAAVIGRVMGTPP